MKMVEIKYQSHVTELNKLNARLERAEKKLEKKQAAAEKQGVADWTNEDRLAWLKTVEVTDMGWIVNKADQKKNGAWFDLYSAIDEVEEIKGRIERAEARFEKAEAELEEYHKELEEVKSLKEKEELWKLEFEQEQKAWAKDGIKLERRYSGETPNGKRFAIYGNNGFTNRSLHCYTLYIDGETIFTSGEFWRAYGVIKNS